MKYIVVSFLYVNIACFIQNAPLSTDKINIKQANGTVLSIVGKGNMFIPYTETTDGYVIVRNAQTHLYEYAIKDSTGDLISSGVLANDVKKRKLKEKRFLIKQEKHLHYSGAKLSELQEKAKKYKNVL